MSSLACHSPVVAWLLLNEALSSDKRDRLGVSIDGGPFVTQRNATQRSLSRRCSPPRSGGDFEPLALHSPSPRRSARAVCVYNQTGTPTVEEDLFSFPFILGLVLLLLPLRHVAATTNITAPLYPRTRPSLDDCSAACAIGSSPAFPKYKYFLRCRAGWQGYCTAYRRVRASWCVREWNFFLRCAPRVYLGFCARLTAVSSCAASISLFFALRTSHPTCLAVPPTHS